MLLLSLFFGVFVVFVAGGDTLVAYALSRGGWGQFDRDALRLAALFLAPFNLFVLAMVPMLVWSQRPGRSVAGPGGLKVIEDPDSIRVRLPRTPAAIAALLTMALVSFVALFVMLFGLDAKMPADRSALVVQVILGVGLATLVLKLLSNRSARHDLIIAPLRRELRFRGKGKTRELRFEQVESFFAREANGGMVHYVDLRWRDDDGDQRVTRVAQLNRADQAAALATWLNGCVGVERAARV